MIGMYYKIKRKYRICRSFVCINGCIILKTYRVKSFGSVLWKNWHIPRIGFMTAYYAVSSYGFLYELQSIVVCFYFKWFAHQDIRTLPKRFNFIQTRKYYFVYDSNLCRFTILYLQCLRIHCVTESNFFLTGCK